VEATITLLIEANTDDGFPQDVERTIKENWNNTDSAKVLADGQI